MGGPWPRVPAMVKRRVTFVPVDHMDQVFPMALVGSFVPGLGSNGAQREVER